MDETIQTNDAVKQKQQHHTNQHRNMQKNPNQQKSNKSDQSRQNQSQKNNQTQRQPKKEAVSAITADEQVVQKQSKEPTLKITFLGGVGEIGKNMTAFEYNNEIIIIDAGISFPGGDLPGVDLVVPDISYLILNKQKIKGIILTHGHEDHIGGLPYVLNDIPTVIYGSRLTLALVENKLKEFPKVKYKAVTVKPRNVLKIGAFTIEFIKVSHSIAGSLALHISTPVGNVVHTGDFKIDFKPIDGNMTDLIRFGELGKKGVSLLLCESTNVCRPGYSMSESNVGVALDELFDKYKENRLIVATFASNIHRMQQIMDLAQKYKRKVAFTGRSMINISETAAKIGELHFNKDIVVDIDKIEKLADKEIVIISTGSQGESMSALSRMAHGAFNKVNIGENDTIILSSSPIPGNEKSVYNVINLLFKKGANVIYDELKDVHVSGHACQEELKTMHALVNPKFFIPVHGEYRHLKRHEDLAIEMGMDKREIILPDLGMQVELGKNHLKQIGHVQAGQRLVDGSGVGDMESSVLKERLQLSEEGFCVVVLNLSILSGEITKEPFIITRGVIYDGEAEKLIAEAKQTIMTALKNDDFRAMEPSEIKNNIKKVLSNFLYKTTKRRPMILTIILDN